MTLACFFPGQGSQAVGMGGELFDRYSDWTAEADCILGYSIRELCLEDPRGQLGLTAFTQPALFVVNALMWRARLDAGQPEPAAVAGHSLGEYNALLAARVFDFATGLELVRERGALMGRVSGGGMAAVIGLTPEAIADVLAASEPGRRLDIANYNAFDQTVIAGPQVDLEAVQADFEAAGARKYTMLKVSAPFHSRYMQEAMDEFSGVLARFAFAPPAIPVISNVTAGPYPTDRVRDTLALQIGSSVRWLDSVIGLLDTGFTEFEEVGPGNVLTKMLARIRKSRPSSV